DGLAKRSDHRRPNRQIGNEMAIHDIQMQNGSPALDRRARFGAKLREIGRQYRWREFNQCGAPLLPSIPARVAQSCGINSNATSVSVGEDYMQVSVFVGTSVDGFIARRNGTFDFLDEGGGEPHGYTEFFASVDALVIGRKTFELVLTFPEWPYQDKPVIVLSSTKLDL